MGLPEEQVEQEFRKRLAAPTPGAFYTIAAELLDKPNALQIRRHEIVATEGDAAMRFLVEVLDALETLRRYEEEKVEDLYSRPLQALTFETFDNARRAWHDLQQRLPSVAASNDELEWGVLQRIVTRWNAAIEREQNEGLLRDFSEFVASHLKTETTPLPNAIEAMSRLAETEERISAALRNAMIRLALFSRPARAAVVSRTNIAPQAVAHWIEGTTSSIDPERPVWPPWLDEAWSAELATLSEDEIEQSAKSDGRVLRVILLRADMSEGPLGFLLFQWLAGAEGVHRFDAARPLWQASLQTFLLQREVIKQHVMSGRVFSMVAHNLGSPIFQIASDAGILLEEFLEGDRNRRLEKYAHILRTARHMRGIVDAILSVDGREVALDLRQSSLAEVVHDAVRAVRTETQGYITFDYPKPEPATLRATTIYTDEVRVYDIVLNLLSNAMKYSPKGGVVRVRVSVDAHGASVTVADQGPGIPDDERSRIFAPFVRGRHSAKIPGLGLGLYVVALYTKSLKGRVSVSSNLPHGTIFTVYLPHLSPRGPG